MKAKVILVVLALAVAGLVGPAGAQTDAEQPSKVEQLRQQFKEERAEILSKVLEKRAELVRLSAQKDPDVKKVQGLVKEISELQSGLWKKCTEHRATMAALGQPALVGALRAGLGPRGRYNVGRGQRWPGSRSEWGRRGRGQGFGRGQAAPRAGVRGRRPRGRSQGFGRGQAAPQAGVRGRGAPGRGQGFGRGQAAPQAGVRGRGAPGRGQGFGSGRGWAPPQAGERGRPFGGGFGPPNRPMMGGRGMGSWGAGPISDDVGDEPAPPSK